MRSKRKEKKLERSERRRGLRRKKSAKRNGKRASYSDLTSILILTRSRCASSLLDTAKSRIKP